MEIFLSTEFDNPMFECRWFAVLTNGQTIYEDTRQDVEPRNSWLRLKKYCEFENLKVESLGLRFRSHIEMIEKARGYYLAHGASGFLSLGDVLGMHDKPRDYDSYVVGRLMSDGKVYIQNWVKPELTVIDSSVRELAVCEKGLIYGAGL